MVPLREYAWWERSGQGPKSVPYPRGHCWTVQSSTYYWIRHSCNRNPVTYLSEPFFNNFHILPRPAISFLYVEVCPNRGKANTRSEIKHKRQTWFVNWANIERMPLELGHQKRAPIIWVNLLTHIFNECPSLCVCVCILILLPLDNFTSSRCPVLRGGVYFFLFTRKKNASGRLRRERSGFELFFSKSNDQSEE